MFIKTRTKHASKGGIELVVFKSFRGFLIEVLSFGLGVTELVLVRSTAHRRALLRSHRDLRRIQTSTQSRKRNKSFIIELESETIKIWR